MDRRRRNKHRSNKTIVVPEVKKFSIVGTIHKIKLRGIMGKIRSMLQRRNAKRMRRLGLNTRGRGVTPEMGGSGAVGESVIKVTTKTIAKHIRNGKIIDERVVLNKKVTTAFVNFIVAQLQAETSVFGDFKWHDSGTGVNGENKTDTTLQTPTGVARASGTQIEGAQTYEYKSVGTITYDNVYSIVEHGLFNVNVAGILMDRTVFASIGVILNDQIEFTFTIQFAAEA